MYDYTKVPVAHMANGVRRYVERGIPPGHFLTALLSNDLMEAFARADSENAAAMHAWVKFLYNEMPRGSYGAAWRVSEWVRKGGVEGFSETSHTTED